MEMQGIALYRRGTDLEKNWRQLEEGLGQERKMIKNKA